MQALMQDSIFELPNGNFLLVPSSIIGTLHRYRQLKLATKEQGGMLMGIARAEKNQKFTIEFPPYIEVISITEPCKYDIATRTSFKRHCNHHLIDIKRAVTKHENLVYLGEWHTHPQDGTLGQSAPTRRQCGGGAPQRTPLRGDTPSCA